MTYGSSERLPRRWPRNWTLPYLPALLARDPAPPLALPFNADWGWAPGLSRGPVPSTASGTRLSPDCRLYHDGDPAHVALRPCHRGVEVTTDGFRGSYLSLVIDLPAACLSDLTRRHVIGLTSAITCSEPRDIFARLNIRHGPDTENLPRPLRLDGSADFDLAYVPLRLARLQTAWLDLILAAPGSCRMTVQGVTLSRRPRLAF